MKMNKKSFVFNLLLFIGTLMVVTILLVGIGSKLKSSKDFNLGSKQEQLLKTYQKGQKLLLYIDQSAKYSAQETIFKLAEHGGVTDIKCTKYLNFEIWDFKDFSKCDQDYSKSFNLMLNESLNNHTSKYPELKIPDNNYDLKIKEPFEIIGISKNNIPIPISSFGTSPSPPSAFNEMMTGAAVVSEASKNKENIYYVNASFRLNIDYDIEEYEVLRNQAKSMIEYVRECKKNQNTQICAELAKSQKFLTDLIGNSYELLENCGSHEIGELMQFEEYIEDCKNSKISQNFAETKDEPKSGCVCRNKPKSKIYDIEKKDEEIKITKISDVHLGDTDESLIGADTKTKEEQFLHKDLKGNLHVLLDIASNDVCEIEKEKFRFCVKSNKNKFYFYEENGVKERNVIYKFALDFSEKQ